MTTPPKPLKASPLHIEHHEFLDVELHASENDNLHHSLGLKVERKFSPHEDDPLRWRIELTVRFGGNQDEITPVYTGLIRIAGYFKIHETYPAEKAPMLIEVTGASMLYGACREMLASLTARSSKGMVTLPSVSFVPHRKDVAKPVLDRVAEEAPSYGSKKPIAKKRLKK